MTHYGQGGMVIAAKLPYTGIMITSSTAKYANNIKNSADCKGIQVDYQVSKTWADYIAKRDPNIELVYELIQ